MIIEQFLNFNFWLGLMPGWIPLVVMGTGIGLIIASSLIKMFLPIQYRIVIIVVYFSGIIIALSGAYIKGRVDVLVNSKKEIEILQNKQEQITQKIVEQDRKSVV